MKNTDNKQKRLWVYAVLIVIYNPKTDQKKWVVKFGDTRQETYEDAHRYASTDGNTVGKLQGLVGNHIFVLTVDDVTDIAISKNPAYDPNIIDDNMKKGFDNVMRKFMPGDSRMIVNDDRGRSLELHIMDDEDGTLTYERCEYLWKTAISTYKNGGVEKKKNEYYARDYLEDCLRKNDRFFSEEGSNKYLLAAATGAGKETSTLTFLIHNHDQQQYDNTRINVFVATIPSTTSESLNELATVSGMNSVNYGFIDFSRIKPYITEQWCKVYEKDCSEPARDYIDKSATIVNSVSEIPTTHEDGVVPVLFGSFHDLALKSDENKIDKRYAGLDKRIGTLAIGEAHQMLSNADNKMWKNLNNVFGKKCFKLFITGTPYDFIYGNAAAEFFGPDERSLFTRNDLYKDKRSNPNSDYKDYPDYNFYGIDVRDVVDQLKKDYLWEGDENGFTFSKLFTYDPKEEKFLYEETILWLFKRMFGSNAFSEKGDPLSIYNAPELCPAAKRHGMIALPTGNKNASAKVYISALRQLLVNHGVFQGDVFCSYKDDLGDRKDSIANAKGKTLTLTCNKDCTGANIPELGYFVFMRKLGDSVKFFEQATGRVGRKYPEKTNCGVFLADLENSMNVMLTIEEKIAADRDENSSVRDIIEELLANYNFFIERNGKWESLEPEDFAKALEELNAKGNYGINQCLRNTDPDEEFNLIVEKINNSDRKRIDINSNGNKGAKNSNRIFVLEEMKLPVDKTKSFKQNWINIKLIFASKCRMLAFLKGAKTVQDCVEIIQNALDQNDEETLKIVDENVKGVEWFPVIMTDEHIDVRYTNRWIQKFNDNCENVENLLEMLSDPIHRTNTFVAEPNILLEKITNKVIQILKNKNDASFIDPCGGRGGFIIYILKLAQKSNIKIDLNKVYYNDNDLDMVRFFKHLNKEYNLGIPEDNITSEDFCELEFDVKFDLIIGNPPYQDDTDCQKLWNKICLKCTDILNDDGIIAMITPQTVISGSTSSIKAKKPTYQLQEWLQDKEFILYSDEADKHFDVGIPICYWIAKNSNSVNETEFSIDGKVYNKRYLAGKNVVDTLENSIIESVTNSERHQYYRRVRTEFGKKDGYPYKVSDEETDEFRYKVIWNSSKFKYKYTNARVNCNTKLAMNNYKKWEESEDNLIITDLDVAPSYFSIVGDRNDLEKLRDLLTTKKIFKFVGNKFLNTKGVFLFAQRQYVIPILDLDIAWTDEMLYEEFGLTEEQIDHIESSVE